MPLTLNDLDFLASDAGQSVLTELAQNNLDDAQTLKLLTHLRRTLSPEQASAALTMARLRQKATAKFGEAAYQMFFTEEALQQASDPLVCRYRAQNYHAPLMIDACCGIGTDTLAFAQAEGVRHIVGYDMDAVRIAIARYNAGILGIPASFEVRDVVAPLSADVIFFDPARRDDGRRIFHPERYIPPLSTLNHWQASRIVAKLSPGIDLDHLKSYVGGVEFISVQGQLKEALLIIGDDFTDRRAVLLTHEHTLTWQRATPPDVTIDAPRRWLVEPDPALIRAGLVEDAAEAFHGALLDPDIAYFTTDKKPVSPWVRSWEILDWLPFQLKRLKAYLRERGIGRLTIKKRGFPMSPEEIAARLKLKGEGEAVLVFTRHHDKPIVMVCAPFEIS